MHRNIGTYIFIYIQTLYIYRLYIYNRQGLAPGAVAESVERGPRVQEIGSSVPGRVKPMTYKIYKLCFLARRSV